MDEAASTEIHQGMPILKAGRSLDEADRAVILVHGRGGTAASILSLADAFSRPAFAYLAPQARGNSWYPFRFLAPIEQNEPYLSSALRVLDEILDDLERRKIPPERTLLGGFSQGACLAAEYAARRPRRYGGIFVLSGGLIGPEGLLPQYEGELSGTPVFLGCSDQDAHIPLYRVKESTNVFESLGGAVTERIYHGMGHTVNDDEIAHVVRMMDAVSE